MSTSLEAEENLRVIRSLMEKATVYRAISAPGALVGGLASLAAAAFGIFGPQDPSHFLPLWAAVLLLTSISNVLLLHRDARRRNEAFVSSGMRVALRAMLPAIWGGGLSILVNTGGSQILTVALWILFYGISLLAASHFAPTSIRWLGTTFFATASLLIPIGAYTAWHFGTNLIWAHGLMGATFGAFHIVYAVLTWPGKRTL